MPETELKLFKRCVEFQPLEEIKNVPPGIRGIYALLRWRPRIKQFDVVDVGTARTGVLARASFTRPKKSQRGSNPCLHLERVLVVDFSTCGDVRIRLVTCGFDAPAVLAIP
jgi:hypothetical protein